jgi:hypothetical protein
MYLLLFSLCYGYFYELYFLKIMLLIRNKEPSLSETELPFS